MHERKDQPRPGGSNLLLGTTMFRQALSSWCCLVCFSLDNRSDILERVHPSETFLLLWCLPNPNCHLTMARINPGEEELDNLKGLVIANAALRWEGDRQGSFAFVLGIHNTWKQAWHDVMLFEGPKDLKVEGLDDVRKDGSLKWFWRR